MASPINPPEIKKVTRARVLKACDHCRRRKNKCDGRLSCGSCQSLRLECSFGHATKQTKGPLYVARLEQEVQALQDELHRTRCASVPTGTYRSPLISPTTNIQRTRSPSSSMEPPVTLGTESSVEPPSTRMTSISQGSSESEESKTQSLASTITTEPRGKRYGLDILRQLCNLITCISPLVDNSKSSSVSLLQALGNMELFEVNRPCSGSLPLVPEKQEAARILHIAFTEVLDLWPFVDRTPVDKTLDCLYGINPIGHQVDMRDELALLYALLALGQRYDPTKTLGEAQRRPQRGSLSFAAARDLITLTNCDRSLAALQTVTCLALYTKAACDQNSTHAYITAAMSAALRMSLHTKEPYLATEAASMTRRLWSTICTLDVFISGALGVPRTVLLSDEDGNSRSSLSYCSMELDVADDLASLAGILNRSITRTYHGTATLPTAGFSPLKVPIDALETGIKELNSWEEGARYLSQPLEGMTRSQLMVAYAHDHARLLLFSPFVHYLVLPSHQHPGFTYAVQCLEAAKHSIKVADILTKRKRFNVAHFFSIETLAFATMTLSIAKIGSSGDVLDVSTSLCLASQLLSSLATCSHAAAESWKVFESFNNFDKIIPPKRLEELAASIYFQDLNISERPEMMGDFFGCLNDFSDSAAIAALPSIA